MERIIELCNKKQEEDKLMIAKSINHGVEMLHVNDFIRITGFELNEILPIDIMWNTFQKNIPIYITDDLITLFGYKGELKTQKLRLINLVKKYEINVMQFNNEEYIEFTERTKKSAPNSLLNIYPEISKKQLKSKPLHYLIMPQDLKELLLSANTANGKLARHYVIKLEALIKLYLEYQIEYEKNRNLITEKHYNASLAELKILNQKIDDQTQKIDDQTQKMDDMKETIEVQQEVVEEMNSKLDRSTDERAPRTKNPSKHEEFVIARISNEPEIKYYSIRCQKTVVKRTVKKLKARYPQMTIITEISYQPNSKNLYNLMKENLADKITVKGNIIQLHATYTEGQFVRDIQELDNLKKEVETDEEI